MYSGVVDCVTCAELLVLIDGDEEYEYLGVVLYDGLVVSVGARVTDALNVLNVLNEINGVVVWIELIDACNVTVSEASGLCETELEADAEFDMIEDSDVNGDADADFCGLRVSATDDDVEPVVVGKTDRLGLGLFDKDKAAEVD